MSKLIGSAPLFHVTNLKKSLDFYCDILGFERPTLWGDPPGFAMPERDGMIVMLDQHTEAPLHNKGNWDAYFWVNDAQGLYDEFKTKGAVFEYGVDLKKWYGNLEFALKDPDGYFLAFGQSLTDEELAAIRE